MLLSPNNLKNEVLRNGRLLIACRIDVKKKFHFKAVWAKISFRSKTLDEIFFTENVEQNLTYDHSASVFSLVEYEIKIKERRISL